MRRKVLVPLDGSPGSEPALFEAAELARQKGATIRLLHVAAPPGATVVDGRVVEYADQVAAQVAYDARAYLTSAAAALPELEVEVTIRFGDPVEKIVKEAEAAGVALITMATHRRTGLRRLLEGSVAEGVERATRIPVLLVEYGARVAGGLEAVVARAPRSVDSERVVTRRFWCAWSQREVEVEFVERGLPGLRWAVAVRSCSAFDPPTAIECQRRCLDLSFRRQWPSAIPVYGREASGG